MSNKKLPTRNFPSGKPLENRMLESVGGPDTIRTKIVGDTMLKTRAGNPEFTEIKKPPIVVSNRTFVFKHIGAVLGRIANKFGAGLKVLVESFSVEHGNYTVLPVASKSQGLWRDVVRIDGTSIRLNNAVATFLPTTIVDLGRTAVPWVARYTNTCDDDASRSTLFVASERKVSSIHTDGTEKSVFVVSSVGSHAAVSSAGISAKDGVFTFYGSTITMYAKDAPFSALSLFSKVTATLVTPYLSETTYNAVNRALRDGNYNGPFNFAVTWTNPVNTSSGAYSYPGEKPPPYALSRASVEGFLEGQGPPWFYGFNVSYSPYYDYDLFYGTGTKTQTISSGTSSGSVGQYGYDGSPVALSLVANLTGNYLYEDRAANAYYGYVNWPNTAGAGDMDGGGENLEEVTSSLLTEVRLSTPFSDLFDCSVSITEEQKIGVVSHPGPLLSQKPNPYNFTANNVGYSGSEQGALDAIASIEADPAPHGFSDIHYYACGQGLGTDTNYYSKITEVVFSIKTKDHVFADVDENVFLTLDASLDGVQHTAQTGPNLGDITTTNNYVLTVSFTLKYNGGTFSFPVFSGTMPQSPTFHTLAIGTLVWGGNYHACLKPTPVFSPPFMSQSNCPYIAYTTSAEIARGATPEIYVDFKLFPRRYEGFSPVDLYSGDVHFVPHHFLLLYRQYIGQENFVTNSYTRNINFWENVLFPTGIPFKVQFANGIKGVWQSQLGVGYTGHPSMEITRI